MPAVSSYAPTGDAYLDGILIGTKWAVNRFTFSFPTSASFYGAGYGHGEPTSGFQALNATQQAAVRRDLATYASVANVSFTEMRESTTQHADLRYAESNKPGTAWAYYPSTNATGGDAWFNNPSHKYDTPVKGNYAWLTFLHETGHALGLKHPQDSFSNASGSFGPMPADKDSLEYTVMSYRSYVGGSATSSYTNGAGSYPQTLMMYDIAALQKLYGANYGTNAGDTVYKWDPNTGQEFVNGLGQGAPGANKIFMTVWDGGGRDTYDFSNYRTNLSVDLRPGAWTTVSTSQLADLDAYHAPGTKLAAGNIANALYAGNGTTSDLIENAIGGLGSDTITGNDADNTLTGSSGNDRLDGGAGTNTAVFSGSSVQYTEISNADGTVTVQDLVLGRDGTDTLKNIQTLRFSDRSIATGTPVLAPSSVPGSSGTVSSQGSVATKAAGTTSAGQFALDDMPLPAGELATSRWDRFAVQDLLRGTHDTAALHLNLDHGLDLLVHGLLGSATPDFGHAYLDPHRSVAGA